MNPIHNLEDLLLHHLLSLQQAEELQIALLPSIIDQAKHKSLKNALSHQLVLTKEHKSRIRKVLAQLPKQSATASGVVSNKVMQAMLDDANELLASKPDATVNDAAIISCIQQMEHYEICMYGTALAYAHQLHYHKIEQSLKETLEEEYDADRSANITCYRCNK